VSYLTRDPAARQVRRAAKAARQCDRCGWPVMTLHVRHDDEHVVVFVGVDRCPAGAIVLAWDEDARCHRLLWDDTARIAGDRWCLHGVGRCLHRDAMAS
jgi:hypothetical protein